MGTFIAVDLNLLLSQAFTQKIKELVDERRLSQADLAKELGLKQPAVSYLLKVQTRRKRRPHPLDLYAQVAAVLGRELSELIAEAEARVRIAQGIRRGKPSQYSAYVHTSESERVEATLKLYLEDVRAQVRAHVEEARATLRLIEQLQQPKTTRKKTAAS